MLLPAHAPAAETPLNLNAHNPADAGFGNSKKSIKLFDPKINPKPLPSYPMMEIMPTSSTSLNDTVINREQFKIYKKEASLPDYNNIFEAMVHNCRTGAYSGYRRPMAMGNHPAFETDLYDAPDVISADIVRKNVASNPYGYMTLDKSVLKRMNEKRGNIGYGLRARRHGLERDKNWAAQPLCRQALPQSAAMGIPDTDAIRLGNKKVGVIHTFTPNT